MNISFSFIRLFFLCLCILFVTPFTTTLLSDLSSWIGITMGVCLGASFGLTVIGVEHYLKKFNLRTFNTATLGLFFGYLMGEAILHLFHLALSAGTLKLHPESINVFHMIILLTCAYIGMMMTLRAADEIYLSVPFFKFQPKNEKKRDILIDSSSLLDTRIIDLSSSGLLDNHLIIPHFMIKELYALSENGEEHDKTRARRCLEVIKKLEGVSHLNLRYVDTDFSEIKDQTAKLVHLARLLDANIITTDINRVQQSAIEGVRIINLNTLSNALKPLTQTGEYLNIKIQRYGKEARQGVGYLEDGTMVVVNGGADYIGEVIKTQVLSVKHTSSGRMIFCNACEDDEDFNVTHEYAHAGPNLENPNKSYFAL